MDINKLNVNKLRTELWTCHILAEQRCLRRACEWAEDLLFSLSAEGEEKLLSKLEKELNGGSTSFNSRLEHARACFELHEYDRAANLLHDHLNATDDKSIFIHYFSMYKAAEKKRIDLMNEVAITIPKKALLKFNELRDSLERCMDRREPDGWLLYVYALVLAKFKLYPNAIKILEKSLHLTPINWSAWHVLSTLIYKTDQLHQLNLPNHLFKIFFYITVMLDMGVVKDFHWEWFEFHDCKNFIDKYFSSSTYFKTLLGKFLGARSDRYKKAVELFQMARDEDPYRIDSLEVYSNLLYVLRLRKELAKLAYEIERVDPFTVESNSCIANSFSAREQHAKAIVYFTRALRLNPDHLNSWTMIGHEYLEMKNTEKAMQAYRNALSINERDCRAWLGLGNTYETITRLESPNHGTTLYYYSQVGKYRPFDFTMYMALGSIYQKNGNNREAIVCFKRAGSDGLLRLAKLYEMWRMREEAVATYKKWLHEIKRNREVDSSPSAEWCFESSLSNSFNLSLQSGLQTSMSTCNSTNLDELEEEIAHAKRYIVEPSSLDRSG